MQRQHAGGVRVESAKMRAAPGCRRGSSRALPGRGPIAGAGPPRLGVPLYQRDVKMLLHTWQGRYLGGQFHLAQPGGSPAFDVRRRRE